jgi:hypothetical protein
MIVSGPHATCTETTSFLANELLSTAAVVICAQPIIFQRDDMNTHSMRNAPIIKTCVIRDRQQK